MERWGYKHPPLRGSTLLTAVWRLSTPLIFCAHGRLDVAADVEVAFDVDLKGVAGADEVFEDDVDDVLVEDFDVAERVDVELEALEFHAALVRHVLDAEGGEVGE